MIGVFRSILLHFLHMCVTIITLVKDAILINPLFSLIIYKSLLRMYEKIVV